MGFPLSFIIAILMVVLIILTPYIAKKIDLHSKKIKTIKHNKFIYNFLNNIQISRLGIYLSNSDYPGYSEKFITKEETSKTFREINGNRVDIFHFSKIEPANRTGFFTESKILNLFGLGTPIDDYVLVLQTNLSITYIDKDDLDIKLNNNLILCDLDGNRVESSDYINTLLKMEIKTEHLDIKNPFAPYMTDTLTLYEDNEFALGNLFPTIRKSKYFTFINYFSGVQNQNDYDLSIDEAYHK